MNYKENRLNICKTSSKDECALGDILTYHLKVTNISSGLVEDIIIIDLLPSDFKFVKGSVRVNKEPMPHQSIVSGISLKSINPRGTYIVEFDIEVVGTLCKEVLSESMAEYKYFEDGRCFYDFCVSNCNKIFIENPSIVIEKTVDKEKVNLGDELNYIVLVKNNGSLDTFNIHLIDKVSSSIQIIEGSFSINDVLVHSIELDKDILLGNLAVGEIKVIKYKAKVISRGCLGKITSTTKAIYNYQLPNKLSSCKNSNLCTLSVNISISNFKQINIDEYLFIPNQKPNLQEINNILINIEIDKTHVIKTCLGKSTEGQILSGYKLIVNGTISHTVEYVALEPTKAVHCINYKSPFSTFIILPQDFLEGSRVEVEATLEDVYYTAIDSRCFFESVTLLVLAKARTM